MRKQHRDTWTMPVRMANGQWVYGGAARNVRIAEKGGMDAILVEAASVGAAMAVQHFAAQLGISMAGSGVKALVSPRQPQRLLGR